MRRRAWYALGTPNMVRVITAMMLIYALVLGGLIVGYIRVQKCLTEYSDQSARRTADLAQANTRSAVAQLAVAEALAGVEDIQAVRSAADRWAATVRDLERLRAENPPPPPPSERC